MQTHTIFKKALIKLKSVAKDVYVFQSVNSQRENTEHEGPGFATVPTGTRAAQNKCLCWYQHTQSIVLHPVCSLHPSPGTESKPGCRIPDGPCIPCMFHVLLPQRIIFSQIP